MQAYLIKEYQKIIHLYEKEYKTEQKQIHFEKIYVIITNRKQFYVRRFST